MGEIISYRPDRHGGTAEVAGRRLGDRPHPGLRLLHPEGVPSASPWRRCRDCATGGIEGRAGPSPTICTSCWGSTSGRSCCWRCYHLRRGGRRSCWRLACPCARPRRHIGGANSSSFPLVGSRLNRRRPRGRGEPVRWLCAPLASSRGSFSSGGASRTTCTVPLIMGRGIQIHPALVIAGVLAGGEIAGVAGMFPVGSPSSPRRGLSGGTCRPRTSRLRWSRRSLHKGPISVGGTAT